MPLLIRLFKHANRQKAEKDQPGSPRLVFLCLCTPYTALLLVRLLVRVLLQQPEEAVFDNPLSQPADVTPPSV